jgi:hypothetical protein
LTIPPEFCKDAEAFPPALRALLDAELEAGNTIAELRLGFPAPPAGACFILSGPVTTRPRESGGGLTFRDRHYIYCGSFTDDRGFFFLLEPLAPPEEEPTMDAIRAARYPELSRPAPIKIDLAASEKNSPLGRFQRSMVIDYEKWHDGVGYDLDALAAATPAERSVIETLLMQRGAKDWRDVEALAALNTPGADVALKAAIGNPDHEIRLAVAQHAPHLVPETERVASLVRALQASSLGGGLSQALDQAAEFHPKPVVDALFHGALHRDGESAVSFAALLLFVHDKASSPFDWDQRPFLLRFNTENKQERESAFVELCAKIGADPKEHL